MNFKLFLSLLVLGSISTSEVPNLSDAADFLQTSDLVKLNLYQPENPNVPTALTLQSIHNVTWDPTLDIKILIHGWMDSSDSLWLLRMKDNHFLNGNYTVIVVGWSQAGWEYTLAAAQVKKVGKYVASIIMQLIQDRKTELDKIHIVGHCLGAHVAGFTGKKIKKQLISPIARITALDPARSLYEFPAATKLRDRLKRGDAYLVDVIHTCAGRLGFKAAIGDMDFYPNDGTPPQPGCSLLNHYTCSKERAYHLYTESINTKNFLATPCKSWKKFNKGECDGKKRVVMGLHLNTFERNSNLKYYLRTNEQEPYSKG